MVQSIPFFGFESRVFDIFLNSTFSVHSRQFLTQQDGRREWQAVSCCAKRAVSHVTCGKFGNVRLQSLCISLKSLINRRFLVDFSFKGYCDYCRDYCLITGRTGRTGLSGLSYGCQRRDRPTSSRNARPQGQTSKYIERY